MEDKTDVILGLFEELKKNAKTLQGLIMDGLNALDDKGAPDLKLRLAYLRIALQLYVDSKRDVFKIAGKHKVQMDDTVADLYRALNAKSYAGAGSDAS